MNGEKKMSQPMMNDTQPVIIPTIDSSVPHPGPYRIRDRIRTAAETKADNAFLLPLRLQALTRITVDYREVTPVPPPPDMNAFSAIEMNACEKR